MPDGGAREKFTPCSGGAPAAEAMTSNAPRSLVSSAPGQHDVAGDGDYPFGHETPAGERKRCRASSS